MKNAGKEMFDIPLVIITTMSIFILGLAAAWYNNNYGSNSYSHPAVEAAAASSTVLK